MPSVRATATTTLLSVVFMLCVASTGRGQQPRSAEDRAIALYQLSEEHYREGRFGHAAFLLREAYALFPDPDLLYNLARAYEGTGNLAGALGAYERFLEAAPDAEDGGAIEARIETLRAQIVDRKALESERLHAEADRRAAERRAMQTEARTEAVAAQQARLVAAEQVSDLPWVMGGVGVASLAAGGVFRLLADRSREAADFASSQPAAAAARQEAEDFEVLSAVGLVTGAVLAGAAMTWLVIRWTQDGEERARLEASPRGLRLRGAF